MGRSRTSERWFDPVYCSVTRRGSSSLAFAAPPMTFSRLRLAYRVFPHLRAKLAKSSLPALHRLHPPSERDHTALTCRQASSHEICATPPPASLGSRGPSGVATTLDRRPPSRPHPPPTWSLTTSTALHSPSSQTYCSLQPVLGFAVFPRSHLRSPSKDGHATLFPQRGSYPSKNSTHPQLYRVTTAVSLLTLPTVRARDVSTTVASQGRWAAHPADVMTEVTRSKKGAIHSRTMPRPPK